MSAKIPVTRFSLLAAPWLAMLTCCLASAPLEAAQPPTPLSSVASGTPQLQMPTGEPQKLVWQAPAGPGAKAMARGEGKVAADRPVVFVFRPEVGGLHSIGVSSLGSAARLAIYLGDSSTPAAGTTAADGAIRWSSDIAAGAAVKVLVYTAGAEIPFRVEAHGGPGGL